MESNGASESGSASETYDSAPEAGVLAGLKGMVSFYTILPVNIGYREMKAMDRHFWAAPVIGLLFGIVGALVFQAIGWLTGSSLVSAAAAIFAMHVFNRLLHLDGLIDVGDGLTVAGKGEDHLRALKDTVIGAGGMATGMLVTLMLFCEWTALGTGATMVVAVLCSEVCARNAQVSAAAFGTPGNGMAGNSVRSTDTKSLIRSTILSAALMAVSWVAVTALMGSQSSGTWPFGGCLLALIVSVLWGRYLASVAERNFGMVNGDVLGASNESARVLCMLMMIIAWRLAV